MAQWDYLYLFKLKYATELEYQNNVESKKM